MDSTISTASKTPTDTIEEMVKDVGFQLEELEGRINDVSSLTVGDIVDNLYNLNDPTLSAADRQSLVDAIRWDLQSLLDEINIVAGDAEEIGKYAETLNKQFSNLFQD